MPATKTTKSTPSFPSFDAAAALKKAAEGFDLDTARQTVLDGVKQSQQFTLDAVQGVVDAVSKVAPASTVPFATEIQKYALANLDFAASVYASQNEFFGKLVKTLVPAR